MTLIVASGGLALLLAATAGVATINGSKKS
ncbi:hypothetical protein QFZ21_001806 [Microbacterium sp. W4I20]|nr:hypothetical protein [Microbacterium sp. W4I20]